MENEKLHQQLSLFQESDFEQVLKFPAIECNKSRIKYKHEPGVFEAEFDTRLSHCSIITIFHMTDYLVAKKVMRMRLINKCLIELMEYLRSQNVKSISTTYTNQQMIVYLSRIFIGKPWIERFECFKYEFEIQEGDLDLIIARCKLPLRELFQ